MANYGFKQFTNEEVQNAFEGYEQYLKMLTKEVKRADAYKVVNSYTDVLLSERDQAVKAHADLKEELESRGIKVVSKITGEIKLTKEKLEELEAIELERQEKALKEKESKPKEKPTKAKKPTQKKPAPKGKKASVKE